MDANSELGPLSQRFDLMDFTDALIVDLEMLRAGKISVREAQARALLAKQVLRSIHYVVQAQKFLSEHARELPSPDGDEAPRPRRGRRT
jgi:hypothetical protein